MNIISFPGAFKSYGVRRENGRHDGAQQPRDVFLFSSLI